MADETDNLFTWPFPPDAGKELYDLFDTKRMSGVAELGQHLRLRVNDPAGRAIGIALFAAEMGDTQILPPDPKHLNGARPIIATVSAGLLAAQWDYYRMLNASEPARKEGVPQRVAPNVLKATRRAVEGMLQASEAARALFFAVMRPVWAYLDDATSNLRNGTYGPETATEAQALLTLVPQQFLPPKAERPSYWLCALPTVAAEPVGETITAGKIELTLVPGNAHRLYNLGVACAMMDFTKALDARQDGDGAFITRAARTVHDRLTTDHGEGSFSLPQADLAICNALALLADHLHATNRAANQTFLPAAFDEIARIVNTTHDKAEQNPFFGPTWTNLLKEMAPFFCRLNTLSDPLTSAVHRDEYGEDVAHKLNNVLRLIPRSAWQGAAASARVTGAVSPSGIPLQS